MPEFILDLGSAEAAKEYRQLDSFTQGYIEAMFFTDEEQLCEEDGREMPAVAINRATMESRFVGGNSPGFADLAPEALADIIADCKAFQETNEATLDDAYAVDRFAYDEASAGRDFWYTRNRHGVGFWDRGFHSTISDKLCEAARKGGEVYTCVGDDGKVYHG